MLNRIHHLVIGFGACALFACGCNNASPPPVAPAPAASQEDHSGHDHGDHAGHDHSADEHAHGGDSDTAKALASLSAEDRAAAEKQKTCPVSDEPLGAMGKPIKLSVNGREVFICCEGCADSLKDDPAKFLAKLPKE